MAAALASSGINEDALQRGHEDVENNKHPYTLEKSVKPNLPVASRPAPLTWFLVCLGLYLGALLYGLDTTIAADVQASVYEDLREIQKLPWIGIGFPMGSVAVILLIGKIYGIFEIKWLIIASIIIFEAGSALCGAAPSSNALIVGRAIAGIGVTAPIYIWLFPRYNPQPTVSVKHKLLQIDWVGAILNATVFVLFMVVVTFSGSTWRWNSSKVIALWTVFGLTLILYVIQQTFAIFTTPEGRLFPGHFIKSRTLLLLYFSTAGSASAMAVSIYYVPLFFQFTRGDTALEAAVRLLPFITIFVFFVMFAGSLLPVFGRYAPWYFPASVLMIIGAAFMYRVSPDTHTAAIYGFEVLIAVGVGLIFQTGYSVAAANVDPSDVSNTIGFINVAQIGSIAIALSICGALFQNLGFRHLSETLASYGFSEDVLRSALAGLESVVLNKEGDVVRNMAISAIVHTIDQLYALVLAAGVLIFACACFMKWEKLELEKVG